MRRIAPALCFLVLFVAACQSASRPTAPRAALDHVIIGVSDLEEGIAAFTAATGVVPVRGGVHPDRGTENALLSLGDGAYLELIAPQRGTSADNPMVKALQALERPTPFGWALRVPDAASAAAFLRGRGFEVSDPFPGSRRTESGEVLAWSAFGLSSLDSEAVPFFIQWTGGTRHPSATSPGGCALERFEASDPAGPAISRLLDALDYPMTVGTAPRTRMTIGLVCGDRRVAFTTE